MGHAPQRGGALQTAVPVSSQLKQPLPAREKALAAQGVNGEGPIAHEPATGREHLLLSFSIVPMDQSSTRS